MAASAWIYEKCMNKNQTREESIRAYDEIATIYDEFVHKVGYGGDIKCAELLSGFFPDTDGIKVLDIASGTGLVGKALKAKGFNYIDGLDASVEMTKIAKATGAYNRFFLSYIGGENDIKLPVEDDFYDAVSMSGAMAQNMIPINAFPEIIRLVKPGGYIINIFREEILTNVDEYTKLEPLLDSLEKEGKIKRLERTVFPGYQVDRMGLVNVHQVC